MKEVYIYTLSTKEYPNVIRYVGKTINSLRERFTEHLCASEIKKNTHKNNWLKSVLKKGETPIITLLDIVDEVDWVFWETYWISQFKTWGFKLTNKTDGGEGFGNDKKEKGVDMYLKTGEFLKTFKSIREAGRITKITRGTMSGCCNNKPNNNTAGGYVFRFTGEPFLLKTQNIVNNINVVQKNLQGHFIAEFDSMASAQRATGISRKSIELCVRKATLTAGGFIWQKKSEFEFEKQNLSANEIIELNKSRFINTRQSKFIKINIYNEFGILMFECLGDFYKICKENGLSRTALRNSCDNGRKIKSFKYKKCNGWFAVYA